MAQDVEIRGLDELNARLDRFLKQAPEKRREFHERMGDVMEREVRQNVRGSLNDSRGRISGWQRKYVGSGGGYAAVRAEDSSSGPHSPGAITNYLESGHATRKPTGSAKRKRSRSRTERVSGRHFYLNTRLSIHSEVEAEAIVFSNELAALLED